MDFKLVADYSGLNFNGITDLRIDQYFQLLRDAFIYKMEQTEQGREYLNNAKRLETTETDYEAFEKAMRGE